MVTNIIHYHFGQQLREIEFGNTLTVDLEMEIMIDIAPLAFCGWKTISHRKIHKCCVMGHI